MEGAGAFACGLEGMGAPTEGLLGLGDFPLGLDGVVALAEGVGDGEGLAARAVEEAAAPCDESALLVVYVWP